MVGQYGTHVDPPAHFAEGGITMDKIPLKQMILPLIVLDATPYPRERPQPRILGRQSARVGERNMAACRKDLSLRCAPTCPRISIPTRSDSSASPSRRGRSKP